MERELDLEEKMSSSQEHYKAKWKRDRAGSGKRSMMETRIKEQKHLDLS